MPVPTFPKQTEQNTGNKKDGAPFDLHDVPLLAAFVLAENGPLNQIAHQNTSRGYLLGRPYFY